MEDIFSEVSVDIGSGKASELLGGEGVLLFLPGFLDCSIFCCIAGFHVLECLVFRLASEVILST